MSDQKQPEEQPTGETARRPGDETAAETAETAGSGAAGEAAAEERLAAAEAEVARLKDQHLRALAETENVRKRALRDKEDAARYAVTAFARDILTVADNLQRALAAVEADARSADPALDALVAGVEMTEKALLSVFERYGITPIAAEGERFDPHVHDAMFEIPDESVPTGTVVQVVEPGYMIHDRPLRPARVGVSRGGPKAEPPAGNGASDKVTPFPGRSASAYEQRSDTTTESSGSQVDEKL